MDDQSTDRTMSDRSDRSDISVLATRVLSALSERGEETVRSVRASVVNRLVDETLRSAGYDAETLLSGLRAARVGPDQIIDSYIPEAARKLGAMWVDDEIGFARVSIASARLQGLLTLLAPAWATAPVPPGQELNLMMILQAGDTHTLGAHVAAAQLRRVGASVRILFAPQDDDVVRMLTEEPYHMVLFSCSRPNGLASIATTVTRIRSSSADAPPTVLGGPILDYADRVRDRTGVDLVTADVKAALKLCEKTRVKARSVAV